MSSGFYPLSMNSYNNRTNSHKYESWKGTGQYSNPAAVTAGNVRPLTNKDYNNIVTYAPQKARPIKHYRKGTAPVNGSVTIPNTNVPAEIVYTNPDGSTAYINQDRHVRSSTSQSLVAQTIDQPGRYSVKQNPTDEEGEIQQLDKECVTCTGIGLATNYYPSDYLTNNPTEKTTNAPLCCNESKKALRRVRGPSTILKPNYYTTLNQYRQNRCQTYKQRAFNFVSSGNPKSTPGTPGAMDNTYVANCFPTTCQDNAGCKKVIYKPSNPQFAVEGGVSSSTRTFKQAVTTVEKNVYDVIKNEGTIMLKAKSQPCEPLIARTYWQKPTGGTGEKNRCPVQCCGKVGPKCAGCPNLVW